MHYEYTLPTPVTIPATATTEAVTAIAVARDVAAPDLVDSLDSRWQVYVEFGGGRRGWVGHREWRDAERHEVVGPAWQAMRAALAPTIESLRARRLARIEATKPTRRDPSWIRLYARDAAISTGDAARQSRDEAIALSMSGGIDADTARIWVDDTIDTERRADYWARRAHGAQI